MNDLKTYCKEEWEIVTCVVCALATLLALALYALSDHEDKIPPGGSGAQLDYENIVAPGAYAFLRQDAQAWVISRSPFEVKKVQPPAPKVVPEPPRPPRRQPENKPAAPPQPPPPVAPSRPRVSLGALPSVGERPEPGREQGAAAAQQMESCEMTFTYQFTTSSGKATAVVSVKRPGQPAISRSLAVGEEIEGIRILSISAESLRVRDARGLQKEFRFSETWPVWAKKNE
jgi:outer membrane biosynthesis protein TonB